MMSVSQRRAQKAARLSLPLSRWSVQIAALGGLGYIPGYPWMSGALVVTLATPFALWPLYVWGGPLLVGCIALAFTLIGSAALIDIAQHGQPSDFDARPVVIDEFIGAAFTLALGMPLLMHFLPVNPPALWLQLLWLGVLFRVFDITKPFPASWLDVHWHTPFSIQADDLVAAFYAALLAPLPFFLLQ